MLSYGLVYYCFFNLGIKKMGKVCYFIIYHGVQTYVGTYFREHCHIKNDKRLKKKFNRLKYKFILTLYSIMPIL